MRYAGIWMLSLLAVCPLAGCFGDFGDGKSEPLEPVSVVTLNISEPSGLCMGGNSGELYVVSDSSPDIYRISKNGVLLETIDFNGDDLEGVAFDAAADTLYVVEEGKRKLTVMETDGTVLDEKSITTGSVTNKGLEGICYSPERNGLFVVNEAQPGELIELGPDLSVRERFSLSFADDYSGLCWVSGGNEGLWVLSHESRSLTLCGEDGTPRRSFSFDVEQAEGVAIDRENNRIYIVCDATSRLYTYVLPE